MPPDPSQVQVPVSLLERQNVHICVVGADPHEVSETAQNGGSRATTMASNCHGARRVFQRVSKPIE
jgi:hypothetical protein